MITEISDRSFKIFIITFAILFVIEVIVPGFVTSWFNPLYLLIIGIVFAIISIATDE